MRLETCLHPFLGTKPGMLIPHGTADKPAVTGKAPVRIAIVNPGRKQQVG